MLDNETRRRIDTARDILVGKVPDPKSQVEQITIALIYKFMDDMDAETEELGGARTFFAGDFGRYGWAKLMRSGLGGNEVLNLYAEAISRMTENTGVPSLFREIFKNAYLPYRDPETLKSFLKVIDGFTYDHSERLGDAFEYLLSVLGSQGDAGQFRTPRHLIDFIVQIVDPQKGESLLDPACGTAGFLISAYKHILAANARDGRPGAALTPGERARLGDNLRGYDISPDMVRLSLVNLYLHGFAAPHIYEYDTLTSEDRWGEHYDVILANPPFMSPKGGIKPHKRFSIASSRSEVLFVDYIAEHLAARGRAGVIVPEGVIFQSQGAYKALRKLLVESALVAVISLPAGVFNPYSGVKTSILILDKGLAKRVGTIGFFKVENDGFGLGAQRRPVEKNDLPAALDEVREYLRRLRAGEALDDYRPTVGLVVEKAKIAAGGEYGLSGERYRENDVALTSFPYCAVKDIALEIRAGFASGKSSVDLEGVPHVRPMNIREDGKFTDAGMKYISEEEYQDREDYSLEIGDVLFNNTNSAELVGKTCYVASPLRGGFSNHITRIRVNREVCEPYFLALMLHGAWRKGQFADRATRWVGQAGINSKSLAEFQIPLPPLDVQREIVAEIEGYQKVIDGARQVVENYRPRIAIDPAWPVVILGEHIDFVSGLSLSIPDSEAEDGVPILSINNIGESGELVLEEVRKIRLPASGQVNYLRKGDLLFNWRNGSKRLVGKTAYFDLDGNYVFASFLLGLRPKKTSYCERFLWILLNQFRAEEKYITFMRQNVNGLFNREELKILQAPLPPLATQQTIVAEIEAEGALVAANRELIARFERKIAAALARVWGEE